MGRLPPALGRSIVAARLIMPDCATDRFQVNLGDGGNEVPRRVQVSRGWLDDCDPYPMSERYLKALTSVSGPEEAIGGNGRKDHVTRCKCKGHIGQVVLMNTVHHQAAGLDLR